MHLRAGRKAVAEMNEAQASAKFQKMFRQRNPGAVLIKHRDSSMVGCPDASATGNGRVVWLEYKFDLYKKWMDGPRTSPDLGRELLVRHSKGAEAQRAMMNRLNRAAASLYIMWVHKTGIFVVDPVTLNVYQTVKEEQVCSLVESYLNGTRILGWPVASLEVDVIGL